VSFPAYEDFGQDIRVGFATWKVYMYLERNILNHQTAKEVKVWVVAEKRHIAKRKVILALNWLVVQGYLIEHPRAHSNSTRSFTLAYRRAPMTEDSPSKAA
jgi:hypothetical protein